jgi:NAD-dependent deacetylase
MSKQVTKIVIISGAGISAESGLATFRDPDGLWQQYDLGDLATPQAFARNPALVHRFYNARRIQAAKAQPNAAHLAIAKLEQAFNVVVVTQNVDDLHERAGSSKVLHLHGKLNEARSSIDPKLIEVIADRELKVGELAKDGSFLRPNIVWFGEEVPAMQPAMAEVARADKILVVGTSLQVYPAASLLFYARDDAEKVLINLEATDNDAGYQFIKGKAATEVPKLVGKWLEILN